jgi:hypothetical protein
MKKIYFTIICGLLMSCANIVAPTGGANDTQAPIIKIQTPENNTLNFQDNHINLHFDEYVEVGDIQNNIVFSPPLDKVPTVSISGKNVQIKFNEPLKPNTTYHIQFLKDAIKDYHAGNSLVESKIIFSTGDQIDSAIIKGVVFSLGNVPADKKVKVVLTSSKEEFLKGKFNFLSGLDINNYFYFKNLPNNGKYYIYSFIDENLNNKYDSAEVIGFRKNNFLASQKDTTFFIYQSKPDEKQKLISFKNPEVGVLELDFAKKVNKLNIESDILKQGITKTELSKDKKKITIWYSQIDSAKASFKISANNDEIKEDQELNLITKKGLLDKDLHIFLETAKKGRDNTSDKQNPKFPIKIELHKPLEKMDTSRIKILEDSIKPIKSIITLGTKNRTILINATFKEGKTYYIAFKDSALKNILDINNKAFSTKLDIGKEEEFGKIEFIIKKCNINKRYIAKVLRENQEIYSEIISNKESTRIILKDQPIGNYRVEITFDDNKDGEWNTGNFFKGIQPEEIKTIGSVVFKAGGMDLEQEFEIK